METEDNSVTKDNEITKPPPELDFTRMLEDLQLYDKEENKNKPIGIFWDIENCRVRCFFFQFDSYFSDDILFIEKINKFF